ncbi:peroxisome biogenesis protein 22-like [Cynara cardunculus var. scolymus]|uniref:peroxisome biogenesis protein 22-like n=1 Tax=Cynara cardunculus var. scolymus TaxID=59895 RepID=UPI000D627637|nr:peroxisome biogenesis protein 22-like [Cynara cardunculus var. scolymus]
MDDYLKDDISQLIKRIGAFLSSRISELLNTQDLRSVWALAALVVTVIFTWRLFWAPTGPQRRQPKRQAPTPSSSAGVSSQPNANLLPSHFGSSIEDSTQAISNEFSQHVKPTLGQIVRQRLSDGRKVTCRLLGIILEESIPEELQIRATVRSSVLEVLVEMTKFCDLYLMETVLDDESEKRVLAALENAGIFTSGGLVKDKVLFCSTENGRTSFVRQLEPDWHIDSNPEINSQLARFIKCQLHISPLRPEQMASNVFSSSSLEQFFGV